MPGETQYRLTDTSGREVPLTEAEQAAEEAREGEWFSTLWTSVEGSSRLTADDIPDETGDTDDDVAEERSEEHTSELQSRGHLVCRLLLEKKKQQIRKSTVETR